MVPQPRETAEYERVAGLERHRLDGVAAPHAAEEEPRRVAERHRHDRQSRRNRLGTLILVLVQPHAALRIVVVEDAEIGGEGHAGGRGDPASKGGELVGQRRRREIVEVAARRLVSIGLPVPVSAETQHPDVHLSAAAYGRHVRGHGAVDERATLRREPTLSIEREVARQVHRAGRDFHRRTLPLAPCHASSGDDR